MNKLLAIVFAALLLGTPAPGTPATPPTELTAGLPADVADLREEIYNAHDYVVVEEIIREHFGEPDYQWGSGILAWSWLVEEGTLLSHPYNGVSYENEEGIWYLIKTENRLLETIHGKHDVATLPDEQNHGTMVYIGPVELKSNGEYLFDYYTYNNASLKNFQRNAMFIHYPTGTWAISYAEGFNENTILELVADNTKVATITFAAGGKTFVADVVKQKRWLDFDSSALGCVLRVFHRHGPYDAN